MLFDLFFEKGVWPEAKAVQAAVVPHNFENSCATMTTSGAPVIRLMRQMLEAPASRKGAREERSFFSFLRNIFLCYNIKR